MTALRLVIFDVDGTLVDSQGDILAAMRQAFGAAGLTAPGRERILSIVGLSLDVAIPRLAPEADTATHARLVEGYKQAYIGLRAAGGVQLSSPLYPGALEVLHALNAVPDILLGVATGKSRRGLDKLIDGHGLQGLFVTQQVSDHHPSKPHPSMLQTALAETGVEAHRAVMVGDTTYDMDMARAAGLRAVGVSWGYHDRAHLSAAETVVDEFSALPAALERIWETAG